MKRSPMPPRKSPMSRSQKLAEAGFKRRPTWKSLPSDEEPIACDDSSAMQEPAYRMDRREFCGLPVPTQAELADQLVRVHFGISGPNEVFKPQDKREPIRDEAYRRWVASMPCIRCGVEGRSQAAHPNFGKGMAQKTDDTDCFPLCGPTLNYQGCHANHDLCFGMTREERRQRELDYIAVVKAMHEGKIL